MSSSSAAVDSGKNESSVRRMTSSLSAADSNGASRKMTFRPLPMMKTALEKKNESSDTASGTSHNSNSTMIQSVNIPFLLHCPSSSSSTDDSRHHHQSCPFPIICFVSVSGSKTNRQKTKMVMKSWLEYNNKNEVTSVRATAGDGIVIVVDPELAVSETVCVNAPWSSLSSKLSNKKIQEMTVPSDIVAAAVILDLKQQLTTATGGGGGDGMIFIDDFPRSISDLEALQKHGVYPSLFVIIDDDKGDESKKTVLSMVDYVAKSYNGISAGGCAGDDDGKSNNLHLLQINTGSGTAGSSSSWFVNESIRRKLSSVATAIKQFHASAADGGDDDDDDFFQVFYFLCLRIISRNISVESHTVWMLVKDIQFG
jgi:hypothetical protein